MLSREFEREFIAPLIAALSAYEAIAIISRRFPTLSSFIWSSYETRGGQIALWMIWGWLTSHFFGYGKPDPSEMKELKALRKQLRSITLSQIHNRKMEKQNA